MKYDRTVFGYHGCEEAVAQQILEGSSFRPSNNDYDWLGPGTYFWEYGPERAWQFAQRKCSRPAVVGAIIQLGNCFDLTDIRHTQELALAFHAFSGAANGRPLPINKGGVDRKARRLDCAVVNFAMQTSPQPYDCVRCSFQEGNPVYPGAGMTMEAHTQIAIRNPACIIGTFRPML